MRKLNETELFKRTMNSSDQALMMKAVNDRVLKGIQNVTPDLIESELVKLKGNLRRSGSSILGEAIGQYEREDGYIVMANLSDNSGRSDIPATVPFIVSSSTSSSGVKRPIVIMNLHRIGRFTNEGESYTGLSANTDLFGLLESATVTHKLLVENKIDKVLNNYKLLEHLTKIYVGLFSQTIVKTSSISLGGVGAFNNEVTRYLSAKFFLLYVLGLKEGRTLNELAFKITNRSHSLDALQIYEESAGIVFDNLSEFLETLGLAIFSTKLDIYKFSVNWVSMYGEGTMLTIEYLPFLLHFLLSSRVGAYLGGNSRFMAYRNQLDKDGLSKLYNELIATIR